VPDPGLTAARTVSVPGPSLGVEHLKPGERLYQGAQASAAIVTSIEGRLPSCYLTAAD